MVVQEDTQVERLNYTKTFAPVAKMVSVWVFLAVAVIKTRSYIKWTSTTSFYMEIFMSRCTCGLTPGFSTSSPNKVCKLCKSLYALQQSPQNWFAKLTIALRSYGFLQSYVDYTLFTYKKGDIFLFVLVYVDELILAGTNKDACSRFKEYLNDCFKLKDLNPLKYFLGIEVAPSPRGIFLS